MSLATGPEAAPDSELWAGVVGQPQAVAELVAAANNPVHAYLLVGPPGVGKAAAARAFAGALLSDGLDEPAAQRARHLALAGTHPDLTEVERTGNTVVAAQAEEIVRIASLSPVEGNRKVLLLNDFHLIEAAAAPKLLKTIEEPPPGTVFVILAEDVPPDLVTIASRCVRIDFGPVPKEAITGVLIAEGVEAAVATEVSEAARGSLARARLLAVDPQISHRRQAWRAVPGGFDGTGATAAALVDELTEMIDEAQLPLTDRQSVELEALAEREAETGTRGSGRRDLEARHKREARRHRNDELRFGLGELASVYRSQMATGEPAQVGAAVQALDHIVDAQRALLRNPSETLLLQALFSRLSRL